MQNAIWRAPVAEQLASQELAPRPACKMLSGMRQWPSSWRRRSLRCALHAKCYPACASGRAAGAAGACAASCMQNAIRRASRRVAGAVHAKCYRARASGRAAGAAGACACKMLSGVPRPSSGRRRNSNRSCVLKCCSARKVPSGVPVSEYPAPQGDVTDADSVDTHSIANVVVRRFVGVATKSTNLTHGQLRQFMTSNDIINSFEGD